MFEQETIPYEKLPDCFKNYNIITEFRNKTREEKIIDVCLDACNLWGEERTMAEIEIRKKLGLYKPCPCEME